jgi:hypothetical protein
MEGFLFQDWVTIRGAAGVLPTAPLGMVIQAQPFWIDMSAYRDVMVWLDVRNVDVDVTKTVKIAYETAPTCDESLFAQMITPLDIQTGVAVTQLFSSAVFSASLTTFPPLARWFRWKLFPSAATAASWDVTFRIFLAANRPGYGGRVMPVTGTSWWDTTQKGSKIFKPLAKYSGPETFTPPSKYSGPSGLSPKGGSSTSSGTTMWNGPWKPSP